MYIEKTTTYYDNAGQHTRQANFFILIQTTDPRLPIKAVVRKVALRQCGHFMMGVARIGGVSFVISGAYGSDGLPLTVPGDIYANYGLEVPPDLAEEWAYGDGWNSAGREAPAMREWALEHLNELRPR